MFLAVLKISQFRKDLIWRKLMGSIFFHLVTTNFCEIFNLPISPNKSFSDNFLFTVHPTCRDGMGNA